MSKCSVSFFVSFFVPFFVLCFAFLLLFLVFAPGLAHAQIVNVQSMLEKKPEPGMSGAFSAGADWKTGNTDYVFLTASPLVRYRAGDHAVFFVATGDYKTSQAGRLVGRTLEHLRYRFFATDWLTPEAFLQHTFDVNRRLQVRALAGAGPRFAIVDEESLRFALGTAYMLEHERIAKDQEIDGGTYRWQHRSSTYGTFSASLSEYAIFAATAYFQPRWDQPQDFRMLGESELVNKITESLSVKTRFTVAYDSRPPALIKRHDTSLTTELTIEW